MSAMTIHCGCVSAVNSLSDIVIQVCPAMVFQNLGVSDAKLNYWQEEVMHVPGKTLLNLKNTFLACLMCYQHSVTAY